MISLIATIMLGTTAVVAVPGQAPSLLPVGLNERNCGSPVQG